MSGVPAPARSLGTPHCHHPLGARLPRQARPARTRPHAAGIAPRHKKSPASSVPAAFHSLLSLLEQHTVLHLCCTSSRQQCTPMLMLPAAAITSARALSSSVQWHPRAPPVQRTLLPAAQQQQLVFAPQSLLPTIDVLMLHMIQHPASMQSQNARCRGWPRRTASSSSLADWILRSRLAATLKESGTRRIARKRRTNEMNAVSGIQFMTCSSFLPDATRFCLCPSQHGLQLTDPFQLFWRSSSGSMMLPFHGLFFSFSEQIAHELLPQLVFAPQLKVFGDHRYAANDSASTRKITLMSFFGLWNEPCSPQHNCRSKAFRCHDVACLNPQTPCHENLLAWGESSWEARGTNCQHLFGIQSTALHRSSFIYAWNQDTRCFADSVAASRSSIWI